MMLKKSRVKLVESEIIPYPTTQMMRNLLVAQVRAHTVVGMLNAMFSSPYKVVFLCGIR